MLQSANKNSDITTSVRHVAIRIDNYANTYRKEKNPGMFINKTYFKKQIDKFVGITAYFLTCHVQVMFSVRTNSNK